MESIRNFDAGRTLTYIGILEGLTNDMNSAILAATGRGQSLPPEIFEIATRCKSMQQLSADLQEDLVTLLDVHDQKTRQAEELEILVRERTQKLEESFAQTLRLKEVQDADYFLISLLLKPLLKHELQSEHFRVYFDIEQYKKIFFKNRYAEIGGDICAAQEIWLGDQRYCLLMNADAMGKSMQGAAGSLILSAVLRTLISRPTVSGLRGQFPEHWLISTFIDLHRIFECFEYSMMASMFIGLLHEATGILYFINAEHPYPILYRNGAASFVESAALNKIGAFIDLENIHVNILALEAHDILFVGSDGKDDLIIGEHHEGSRIFNEDETRILRHIEAGKGDGEKVRAEIIDAGKLADDYSLLRLQILDTAVTANWKKPRPNRGSRMEFCRQIRAGDYHAALESALRAMHEDPLDEEVVIAFAKTNEKLSNFDAARVAHERLLYRGKSPKKAI